MSETKWTRGPWRLAEEEVGGELTNTVVAANERTRICGWWNWSDNSKMRQANAHLIAAAPDLYAALEALYDETVDYMKINNLGNPSDKHNLHWAYAALSKARGEQPPSRDGVEE